MTRIDFYLLSQGSGARDGFVCRLVHKAYQLGHRLYLLTADAAHSQSLDRLLWTFNPGSFIPHQLASSSEPATPASASDTVPVLIGHQEPPVSCHDTLVSLVANIPHWFSRFERIAEVVESDEAARQQARERFRYYRDRGYPLDTHQL